MKIDFYISSLSGGGAEKVLTTLAKALSEEDNEVSVISLEKRPQFYPVGEKVKLYKYTNKKSGIGAMFEDIKNIRHHVKKSKADVSISFLSRCNLLVLMAMMFKKGKVVVCDRNNPLREHGKAVFLLSNLLYKRADKVMVQTEQIKGFYKKFLRKKIEVIENPLDNEALKKQIEDEMPQREKTILSMGRLEPQKDFVTLINAFAQIEKDYAEWKVKIFGVGDMHDEIAAHIESLGLKDKVIMCGRTEKPFYEMKKADIFVLSSHYEGFPNVLCEAMHAGDICIASDCVSGPRELIQHGENGYLFPVGDVEALISLLTESIKKSNEDMRHKAQETVKRLYIDNNILKWKQMIEEVVEKV